MSDFWKNILRYPRFFVSSFFGLILVMLSPFRNINKNPKSQIFLIPFVLLFILILYNIIINMIGL